MSIYIYVQTDQTNRKHLALEHAMQNMTEAEKEKHLGDLKKKETIDKMKVVEKKLQGWWLCDVM